MNSNRSEKEMFSISGNQIFIIVVIFYEYVSLQNYYLGLSGAHHLWQMVMPEPIQMIQPQFNKF